MRLLKYVLIGVVGLLVLFVAAGALLDGRLAVERSIEIAAPAARVQPLVADFRRWPDWAAWDLADPERGARFEGGPGQAGSSLSWLVATGGRETLTLLRCDLEGVDYAHRVEVSGTELQGRIALQPTAAGVRVTWTTAGELGSNPILKWFRRLAEARIALDFERGLAGMKRMAEAG